MNPLNIDLTQYGIDKELSYSILKKYNNKEIGQEPRAKLKEIPQIDNETILDCTNKISIKFDEDRIKQVFKRYNLPEELLNECKKCNFIFNNEMLSRIGIYLYPTYSYGVLNGGSATSYADSKKNEDFNKELFNNFEDLFVSLSASYKGKAKGITPAFINPNGEPGPTFMELKMRSLLIEAKKYTEATGKPCSNLFPMFQMTSTYNNSEIQDYYSNCKESTYIKELIKETGIDITNVLTGIQPLITAFTHSKYGETKDIFITDKNEPLPLPGGHGQCFLVLKDIFNDLYKKGIRFISIGNVDNIGYTLNPVSLALLALSEKQAAFDFSFKTEFDVKGGVLIRDQFDRINCADLGVAVSKEDIKKAEESSIPILFNCATGLFSLEYLISNIDHIINKLPTRFSDQNKDIGEYSQGEQVTWEIIGLLDDFLIMAIDKYDRFLASKLLLENLVTSGLTCDTIDDNLKKSGKELNKGLFNKLKNDFKLTLNNGKWE